MLCVLVQNTDVILALDVQLQLATSLVRSGARATTARLARAHAARQDVRTRRL